MGSKIASGGHFQCDEVSSSGIVWSVVCGSEAGEGEWFGGYIQRYFLLASREWGLLGCLSEHLVCCCSAAALRGYFVELNTRLPPSPLPLFSTPFQSPPNSLQGLTRLPWDLPSAGRTPACFFLSCFYVFGSTARVKKASLSTAHCGSSGFYQSSSYMY